MPNSEKNIEEFIEYFNDIEEYLKEKDDNSNLGFARLIGKYQDRDKIIRQYADELMHLKDIRNILVHNNEYYAIPNEYSLDKIKNIRNRIINPPKVYPLFNSRVKTVSNDQPIIEVIKLMKEQSYSQIPVVNEHNKFLDLLTNNAISRWLGSLADKEGAKILFDQALVKDVLDYEEISSVYEFISKDALIVDVIDMFEDSQKRGKKLEAVFITNNGKKSEKLLDIITSWDLPEMYSKLEI
ncbi:MAG: CBS domain-containing protein [Bacillota bacterium]